MCHFHKFAMLIFSSKISCDGRCSAVINVADWFLHCLRSVSCILGAGAVPVESIRVHLAIYRPRKCFTPKRAQTLLQAECAAGPVESERCRALEHVEASKFLRPAGGVKHSDSDLVETRILGFG